MNNTISGIVLKSLGGFYFVETPDGVLQCRARGVFRLQQVSPYAGDRVMVICGENSEAVITELLPRKNELVRPPLANLDAVLVVASTVQPAPSPLVLDKLLMICDSKGIEPVLVFTKIDIKRKPRLSEVYRGAGFAVFEVNNATGQGVDGVRAYISGKSVALIGNTGVGKSSLVNLLMPDKALPTGEISKKLGRGRHTTRQVELYPQEGGGYIADTPGFSTVEAARYGLRDSAAVAGGFREFLPLIVQCRYKGCTHHGEEGCAVAEALASGKIAQSRYESYKRIYKEAYDAEHEYHSKTT